MRSRVLVVFVINLMFSCQNGESSSVRDGEQQIDTLVSEYDKNAQLDYSETILENEENKVELSVYKKNFKGVYKIVAESNFGEFFPVRMVSYIKNDKVTATKFSGLSPYIHKGQKREGDKCCAIFQELSYYKSETEIILLKKKLDLMSFEEYDLRTEEFVSLDFVKSEVENPEIEYERMMNSFQELKGKLNL